MISPRYRKVWSDIFENKARAAIVVLSIAVGVFAVGFVAASTIIVSDNLSVGYRAANPASIVVSTQPIDANMIKIVQEMPGVRQAEGQRLITVRAKIGPAEWRSLHLVAVADFRQMSINKLRPVAGDWPPHNKEVLLERSSLSVMNTPLGGLVEIETPEGKRQPLTLVGTVYDGQQTPTFFSGDLNGYVTFETLDALGLTRQFNSIAVITEEKVDWDEIRRVSKRIENRLKAANVTVNWSYTPKPGESVLQQPIDAMVWLLRALGFLALFLSGFLLVNTVMSILAQQVKQIGVMKSIGASTGQVIGMYIMVVFAYGLMALIIAVPFRVTATYIVASLVSKMLNIDILSYAVPLSVFALEATVAILTPIFASLVPVISGARVTVREAIASYGLEGGGTAAKIVAGLLGRLHNVPRPLMLSITNTFRQTGRLTLTLATLVMGGIIFISVYSVRESLYLTADDAKRYYNYDLNVSFRQAYPFEEIARVAGNVTGVVQTERWEAGSAQVLKGDEDSRSGLLSIQAIPPTTEMLKPIVISGRWLLPEDDNAIVLNSDALKKNPWIKIGDEIVLKMDKQTLKWRVVGIVRGVMSGSTAYVPRDYFTWAVNQSNRYSRVQILTDQHDMLYQRQMNTKLTEVFKQEGLKVRSIRMSSQFQDEIKSQFDVIIIFLFVMAILLAVVGGLGLMGTMGINVIERTREIGVLRAIGATNRAIEQIFIVEGVIIGVLSCIIAALMAVPVSHLLSDQVGMLFLNAPLSYVFAPLGIVIWLAVVVLLAAAASFLPAWNAAKVSVLESLNYQ